MLLKKIDFSLIFQILLLGCLTSSFMISSQEYGIGFRGQSYLLDERTALEISPEEYVDVKNELEVSWAKIEYWKTRKDDNINILL